MRIETPPFSILVLAPFSPALDTDSPPIFTVDFASLDEAVAEVAPTIDVPVDKTLCPDGNVAVTIGKMADFRPKRFVEAAPFMAELKQAREYVRSGGDPNDLEAKFPRTAAVVDVSVQPAKGAAAAKTEAIDDILSMVATDDAPSAPRPGGSVADQIDAVMARIRSAILADHAFRAMESAWRGAELVCRQLPSGSRPARLTVVPLPAGDVLPVFDMLENELANTPPDIVVMDLPLTVSPRHMTVLERVMDFAEAMLAPAFVPLAPTFFGVDGWDDLHSAGFIPAKLEGPEYGRWKSLREKSGAGWIITCVGDVLARPRHDGEIDGLFASAAFAAAALCARSVAVHGRPTRFAHRDSVQLDGLDLLDGPSPSPLRPLLALDKLADFKQAGVLALAGASGRDAVFAPAPAAMDNGPVAFRLFLSQLIGFLVRTATNRPDSIQDVETDLPPALSLFIQELGLPDPGDVTVKARAEADGMTPLEISLTPAPEILPGDQQFTFGFGW